MGDNSQEIKYFPVKFEDLAKKYNGALALEDKVSQTEVEKSIGEYANSSEEEMYTHAVEIPSRLKPAIDYAKQRINDLRREVGWLPVDPERMKVAFLEEKYYKEQAPEGTLGFCVPLISTIAVNSSREKPDNRKVGTVFHELMHAWLELKAVAYGSEWSVDDEGDKFIAAEIRRSGLEVMKIKHTGEGTIGKRQGNFLSEMSNYLWQQIIMEEIKEKGWLKEDFHREEMEKNRAMGEKKKFWVRYKDGMISYNRENIAINDDGSVVVGWGSVIRQLTDEIADVYGDGDRKILAMDLLRAKANPREKQKIKSRVDEKFPKGFWGKLSGLTDEDHEEAKGLVMKMQQWKENKYPET
jgi:hypothetical protein